MRTRRRLAWESALLMGLVSGTYSTVLISVGAARIGRSPAIDWMDIGTVLLGLNAIRPEPGLGEIAAGVFVDSVRHAQRGQIAWIAALLSERSPGFRGPRTYSLVGGL